MDNKLPFSEYLVCLYTRRWWTTKYIHVHCNTYIV